MEVIKSEDCVILYGLTPGKIKSSSVYSALEEFMKKKQSADPSDRFNLIVFQKDGPNYLEKFSLNPDHILKTFKLLERKSVKANIAGGIFIAITFIIDVFKKISEKIFRLIILTDDGSCEIPNKYIPVIENLIDKVKEMPFFIDIIHIYAKELQEGQKLKKLVKTCKGSYHKIDNTKELSSVLSILSEKKYLRLPAYNVQKKPAIIKENEFFYINLADEPLIVEEIETCSICFQRDDTGIVKCPSCESVAHKTCWAQWAKICDIGIPHVFRCHICFNILKLDKNFVLDVQAGKISTEIKKTKKKDIVQYLQELEAGDEPKIIQAEDPLDSEESRIIQIEDPMSMEINSAEGNKDKQSKSLRKKEVIKITTDPLTMEIKIIFCPNCGKITTNKVKICPACRFLLF
ncbi:MAG: hypothetical protein ACFFAN_01530 [Promethearchaeota archaeon]